MKFEKFDKVIDELMKKDIYKTFEIYSNKVEYMCYEILNTKISSITSDRYSKGFNLNDSINNVYKFLNSIDIQLANQFMGILNYVDENNHPLANFMPLSQNKDGENEVTIEGKINIYYDNTINDMFNIIHEFFHKFNENYINQYDVKIENLVREYFSESVSILSEALLGRYLVKNNIITENDLNIAMNKRLLATRRNARTYLFGLELINMKKEGLNITEQTLHNRIINCNNEFLKNILIDYKNYISDSQLDVNKFKIIRTQRYIIGQFITQEFLKKDLTIEDFLNLNKQVGNVDANLDLLINEVERKIVR